MRFTVEESATFVRVMDGEAPADVVVRAFGEHFPQGADALERELSRLRVREGFVLTTRAGQRLYVRRVA